MHLIEVTVVVEFAKFWHIILSRPRLLWLLSLKTVLTIETDISSICVVSILHPSCFSYNDASSLFDSTKMKANSTFQRAKEANEEALSLLTQADKQLPTLDVEALRQEAQDIKDKVCSRTKLSYG